MHVICSYCRQPQPEKEPFEDDSITHSICLSCLEHFAKQWDGLSWEEYLGEFDLPIVMVEKEGRFVAINDHMAAMLDKRPEAVYGLLGGEVFECSHARLPDGCGRTEHCVACTVRRAVQHARAGEEVRSVPAYIDRDDGRLQITISAHRVGEVVQLVIDEVLGLKPHPT